MPTFYTGGPPLKAARAAHWAVTVLDSTLESDSSGKIVDTSREKSYSSIEFAWRDTVKNRILYSMATYTAPIDIIQYVLFFVHYFTRHSLQ